MRHRRLDTLAGFAALGVFFGAWAAIVPAVEEATGASKAELGVALLGIGLGSVPAMLVAGTLVNRHGPRAMPVALAALAGAAVLPGLAGSVPALFGALVVAGAMLGAVDVSVNAAASDYEIRTGQRIMQLAHGMFSVGVLGGAVAAGLAREAGAGPLAVLVAVAIVLALSALANRRQPGRLRGGAPPERLRFRRFAVVLGVICGAAFLVEGGIESWSALYLERELGASPAVGALGPASYALAMVVGRFTGHWLTDRITDRRLLGGGALLSLSGLLLAAVAPGVPIAAAAFFLGGLGVSVAAPVVFSAAGRGAGEAERGSAVATVTTLGYAGLLLGPPIMGGVSELLGLRAAFAVLAGFAVLLAAAAPRVALERRPAGEPAPVVRP